MSRKMSLKNIYNRKHFSKNELRENLKTITYKIIVDMLNLKACFQKRRIYKILSTKKLYNKIYMLKYTY